MDDIIYNTCKNLKSQQGFLEAVADKQDKWDYYNYTTYSVDDDNIINLDKKVSIPVPRVSEILDACIGKPYLQNWAAGLGENYTEERQKILNTGTYAHSLIEDFLKYGYVRDSTKVFDKLFYLEQANKCYYNFNTWWHNMIEQGFKIDTELEARMRELDNVIELDWNDEECGHDCSVICPLYGGTADIIACIKDPKGLVGNYILDFKTSRSISIDYFYQTIMYKNAIEFENTTSDIKLNIDGVGIVRCDKFKNSYEYLIINKNKDPEFINTLEISVINMVNWYYNQISSSYQYKLIRSKYLKGDQWV